MDVSKGRQLFSSCFSQKGNLYEICVHKYTRIFANIYMLKYWTSISAKQIAREQKRIRRRSVEYT